MRGKKSKVDLVDVDYFKEIVRKSCSFRQVINYLGAKTIRLSTIKRRCRREQIDYSHFKGQQIVLRKFFLTEELLEYLDGFLLGDGYVGQDKLLKINVKHKEFAEYCMSFFKCYGSKIVQYASQVGGFCSKKPYAMWTGLTARHNDLVPQRKRWYVKNNDKAYRHKYRKIVPNDVRITPKSLMLWYLGDGSVNWSRNKLSICLSTDGFIRDDVAKLCDKLSEIVGAKCTHLKNNRISLGVDATIKFFNIIGWQSPINCYDYKFAVPEWRRKRLKL